MSTIVGLVNASHRMTPALTAAGKQALYTFFFAGVIMQLCRWLAARDVPGPLAVAVATLVPTLITLLLVYQVHSYKGTPEPVLSTIPPVLLGLVSFFLVSRKLLAERASGSAA